MIFKIELEKGKSAPASCGSAPWCVAPCRLARWETHTNIKESKPQRHLEEEEGTDFLWSCMLARVAAERQELLRSGWHLYPETIENRKL